MSAVFTQSSIMALSNIKLASLVSTQTGCFHTKNHRKLRLGGCAGPPSLENDTIATMAHMNKEQLCHISVPLKSSSWKHKINDVA